MQQFQPERTMISGGWMRFRLVVLAAIVNAFVLSRVAAADVIDDFTIVGNGLEITFSLPATTLAYVQTPHSYWYETFPEIVNGVPKTGSLDIAVDYGGPCTGSEPSYLAGIGSCGFWGGNSSVYTPYTLGTFQQAPGLNNAYVPLTWKPGTYQITDYTVSGGTSCPPYASYLTAYCSYPQYTLTIAQEPATPMGATPEPGTLALLSTGLAGGSAFLSRRRRRR